MSIYKYTFGYVDIQTVKGIKQSNYRGVHCFFQYLTLNSTHRLYIENNSDSFVLPIRKFHHLCASY